MRKRSVDRRQHKRYDVEGDWGATLASTLTLKIANIGRGGALVEALTSLPLNAVYPAKLVVGEVEMAVHLRVCHVRPIGGSTGGFVFGIEFLELPGVGAAAIDQLLLQAAADGVMGAEPQL